MKLIVNPHKIEIEKTPVNEREINISKCEFVFADEITNDYVKEAYFTFKGVTYKQIIVNNECAFPSEVLTEKGDVEIGVVAYLVENEEEIKRYNPSPAYFNTWLGSLKDNAENSEPITPSETEQYEQALQDGLSEVNDKLDEMDEALTEVDNLDIDAVKSGSIATVTITNKEGITKSVEIYDGQTGAVGPQGPKGDKGDKGNTGDRGPQGIQGVKGDTGSQGPQGIAGENAKINGVNTLSIEAGTNISIDQQGSTLTINSTASGGGGTSDYSQLTNKPSINGVTLSGNKTSADLGIGGDADIRIINAQSPTADDLQEASKLINDLYELYTNNKPINILVYTVNLNKIKYFEALPKSYYITNKWNSFSFYATTVTGLNDNQDQYAGATELRISGTWTGDIFTATSIVAYGNTGHVVKVLKIDNTYAWTPTGDYNPATKKYVDDSIASAITTTLGGNY